MALTKTTRTLSNSLSAEIAAAGLAPGSVPASLLENPKSILKIKFGEPLKDMEFATLAKKSAGRDDRKGRAKPEEKQGYLKAARAIGEKLGLKQQAVDAPEIKMAYVPNLIIQSDQTLMARVA